MEKVTRNQKAENMQGSPEYAANMARAAAERRILERVQKGVYRSAYERRVDNRMAGVAKPAARNTELPDGLPDDCGCKYAVGKRWCNEMREIGRPYCSRHVAVCYSGLLKIKARPYVSGERPVG